MEAFSSTEAALFTTGLVILILLTLFGNLLVLAAFHQYTPLRTVTNYFIVSLSIADILVAIVSMPIWISYVIVRLNVQEIGMFAYRLWVCFDILSGVSSIMNLTFVSVDRYIHIATPLRYHHHMTSKRAVIIILGIWLYAIVLSGLKGVLWDWERPNYELLISALGFVFPLIVMGFCYIKIFGAARYHIRKTEIQTNGRIRGFISEKELKAVKTIALVVLAFFLCWCPFFILNVIYGFCGDCHIPDAIVTASKWLHYANSALNPIIYACFNKEYRCAFRAILMRRMNMLNADEDITRPLRLMIRKKSSGSGRKISRDSKILDTFGPGRKDLSKFNGTVIESTQVEPEKESMNTAPNDTNF